MFKSKRQKTLTEDNVTQVSYTGWSLHIIDNAERNNGFYRGGIIDRDKELKENNILQDLYEAVTGSFVRVKYYERSVLPLE